MKRFVSTAAGAAIALLAFGGLLGPKSARFHRFHRFHRRVEKFPVIGVFKFAEDRILNRSLEARGIPCLGVITHAVHEMELREESPEPKDTKPGIPQVEVIPGDEGAVYQVIVIVEDELLLGIDRPQSLFVKAVRLQRLKQ